MLLTTALNFSDLTANEMWSLLTVIWAWYLGISRSKEEDWETVPVVIIVGTWNTDLSYLQALDLLLLRGKRVN